MELNHEHF